MLRQTRTALCTLASIALLLSACVAGDAGATGSSSTTSTSARDGMTSPTSTTLAAGDTSTTMPAGPPTSSVANTPRGDETSRDDPAAVGHTVQVGDWRLRVTSVTADATDEILEDDFNDAPGDGEQFFMAGVEATYTGEDSGDFFFDLTLKSVGESAVAYQQSEHTCGLVPEDINHAGEVWTGGTILGNACWTIQSTDAESMVLIAEEFLGGSERGFLSMDPSAEVIEDITTIGEMTIDASSALRFGEAGEVGDWEIRVNDVVANANSMILSETSFNESPVEGHQYFMVNVEATYLGDESAYLWVETILESVGNQSVVYNTFNADCGFVPDGIGFAEEAFPGGTVSGNVCWEIRSDDADSLVMLVSPFGSNDGTRTMFSLSR